MTDRPTDSPGGSPADPGRRLFFRRFAGEVVTAASSVFGAAAALQQESATAARGLLAPEPVGAGPGARPSAAGSGTAAMGFRTAFRWDDEVCRVVDQRQLPGALVDLEVRGVADAVNAIRDRAVVGAPAEAQVAAIALALTAARAREARPLARRATIRGGAGALLAARPGSAALAAAVGRLRARYEALPDDAPGERVASELRAEAEAVILEAFAAHGAIAEHGAAALPVPGDRPLRVLSHGSTGTMGGGQFGTALAAVFAIHHAERAIEVLVPEGRPGLEGARVAAWELAQAGVRVTVVPDAAGPGLIADGDADVVVVGADRVSAAGDVLGTVGGYPLALAAARAGVPFVVFAPTSAIDPGTADGAGLVPEEGRASDVLRIDGRLVAAEGAAGRTPRQDITPADLVSAFVTEEGTLRAPFGPALAAAVAAADARRRSVASAAAAEAR